MMASAVSSHDCASSNAQCFSITAASALSPPSRRKCNCQPGRTVDVQACLSNVDKLLSNLMQPKTPISKSPMRRKSISKLSKFELSKASPGGELETDITLLFPDEILLLIFKQMDGSTLAFASQVNRRWYSFVREHAQELYMPLCIANEWSSVVRSESNAIVHDCNEDEDPQWQLIYATNAAVQNFWTKGQFVDLTPRRLSQRRLFVPMSTESWGLALDQF
eukprot:TRINITY_DN6697_c0_g1_i1.p1 TRINITY_DN6697_c0_g1~~TRINITY_DN6697_c0_g1_i1.p1  ORF type:complete len:221 (+),score=29.04 TRINITY_DN6697_c0_g1_i1:191-853(+)